MIAAYWGRFNPPHKGHMRLIKTALRESGNLIVAIGSAQAGNTKRNPFTGEERKKLMLVYLRENNIDMKKVKVVTVIDGKSYGTSIKNLFAVCKKIDVLYVNKKSIINIAKRRVKIRKFKRFGTTSSTRLKKAAARGEKWEHLTGKSVASLMKKMDGVKRIKKLTLK